MRCGNEITIRTSLTAMRTWSLYGRKYSLGMAPTAQAHQSREQRFPGTDNENPRAKQSHRRLTQRGPGAGRVSQAGKSSYACPSCFPPANGASIRAVCRTATSAAAQGGLGEESCEVAGGASARTDGRTQQGGRYAERRR